MFDGPDLRGVFQIVTAKAIKEASELSDERLLNATPDELLEEIVLKHDMQVPVLDTDQWHATETGSRGAIELHVPFTGTPGLFSNQPNFFTSQYPDGSVVGEEVVVPLGPASGADARAQTWKQLTERYLEAVTHDVDIWRRELRDQVRGSITRRRQEAEQHRTGLQSLAIPIRRRDDAPRTFTAPAIVRRKPQPPPSSVRASTPAEPEVRLSDDYYEHILFVIRAAGRAMERSPETYRNWGEEDRRQVLILMLNTHYAGKVVAEAFNADGKTDILIRERDRNVFIGECKFYGGPQSVKATLTQLFGYATWRDVKLAIVFFVDRVGFSDALEKIRNTVAGSDQFRHWIRVDNLPEGEFRAQMEWPGDDQRLVTLHVSAFHTPGDPVSAT